MELKGAILKTIQVTGPFVGLWLIVSFEHFLIRLAKRYLPRGSKIRKFVLWSRADEPDEVIPKR